MNDEDQKHYAQIVELAAAIKKKLCTTWRSEQLDKQAIADLKFAISSKKDILDADGVSKYEKLVKDFENWVYEVEPEEVAPIVEVASAVQIEHDPAMLPVIASQTMADISTQKTL